MAERVAVILAGGRGERFWPQSRTACPKHLLPIVGDRSMLAQTIGRLAGVVPGDRIFVLTSANQAAAVRAACPELGPDQVWVEPMGRDTAPAVAMAALLVAERFPGAALAMLPADQVIGDEAGFRATLTAAFAVAEGADTLVTVGIPPDHPATGYGYLLQGEQLGEAEGRAVYRVQRFVEKPDRATARRYLADGSYLWNAGIFVWRAEVVLAGLRQHAPEIAAVADRLAVGLAAAGADESARADVLAREYPAFPKRSIDFALMEKAEDVRVLAATFDWDDVGAWPALRRHLAEDAAGNVVRGSVVLVDASGNTVVTGGRTVALLGVDNLIVVETPDAILVCSRERAQDIKRLVQACAEDPATQHLT